jgi:cytidylate kinase
MAIVTVSRQLAALGDETALELTRRLGYRLVNKQTIEACIKDAGLDAGKLRRYDERKRGLIASLSQVRDDYLHYLKNALLAQALAGNCVIVGRGAAAVLSGLPALMSVFLTASSGARTARVRSYFRCSGKRARQIISQSDRDRDGFHQYFFETAWRDSANYHLCLNTALLTPSSCADAVKRLIDSTVTPDMEAQTARSLGARFLAQKAVHHILYEREIAVRFLDAVCEEGKGAVTLCGVANSRALADMAAAAAKEVPGITDVITEIEVVEDYGALI